MNVVFWIPARDKEKAVEMSVRAALAQTYPCRIVISDQGSTDLTRHVILHTIKDYKGHHQIELKECPEIKNKGHIGFNDHMNWFHKNVEYDVCVISSADDFPHPDRVEKVVKAFEEFNPSMVLNRQRFLDPLPDNKLVVVGESCYPKESRMLGGSEILRQLVGGSSAQAWTREFYENIYPLEDLTLMDVYMPFLASQTAQGCYYLNESLHSYIRWSDVSNMGAQGELAATESEEEKAKLCELIFYRLTNTYAKAALKSEELYPNAPAEDRQTVYELIVENAVRWANQRNVMTMNRIQPKGERI